MESGSSIKDPEASGKEKIFKITAAVLLIILIISLYFIFVKSPAIAPFDGVRISVIPENRTIIKGQEFYVDIFIDPGIKTVSAVQFSLYFNNSMLKFKMFRKGIF